jgi:L-alanine-DL-glutamate epimerase-like enolase superfamily enzyme
VIISASYLYPLPYAFRGVGFATSYGNRTHLNNVLLALETHDGLRGYGEICRMAGNTPEPLGEDSVTCALDLLTGLTGLDPANGAEISRRISGRDRSLNNVRTAVETACCDLVARRAGLPLSALLGGRLQNAVPTYHCVSQGEPVAMADSVREAAMQGYRVFQVKVGDPESERDIRRIEAVCAALPAGSTLLVDANGGWDPATAIALITHCHNEPGMIGGDSKLYWEEPCHSYEENREVALATGAPVILDQCVTGPKLVSRACAEGLVAGIGIKCTMQGGLHRAWLSRDICIAHGMKMKVDDSWAADVGTAASLHLALAVPPELLLCSVDMRIYFDDRVSDEGPVLEGAHLRPADAPGLGLTPDHSRLPEPLAVVC